MSAARRGCWINVFGLRDVMLLAKLLPLSSLPLPLEGREPGKEEFSKVATVHLSQGSELGKFLRSVGLSAIYRPRGVPWVIRGGERPFRLLVWLFGEGPPGKAGQERPSCLINLEPF